jgi:hypothetical protein
MINDINIRDSAATLRSLKMKGKAATRQAFNLFSDQLHNLAAMRETHAF